MKSIEDFRHLSDEQWLEYLIQSVENPSINGLEFPAFPPNELQAQFVGSSNENALHEAFRFYSLTKGYAEALGNPVQRSTKVLDFGCGWGRFLRFFWKDVAEENLYGVDVDPDVLETNRSNHVPGQLSHIEPTGQLPYPDSSFDHIIAYSVFTHLPQHVHQHWMAEMKRVARPGCIFSYTIEPRRFLEFVGSLADRPPESGWHAGLKVHAEKIPQFLADYDAGTFVYLPTGGGKYRDASVYGDAIIPIDLLQKMWEPEFHLQEHIDDPNRFWQAVIVMQRQ